MKTIVVGVDGSAPARCALRHEVEQIGAACRTEQDTAVQFLEQADEGAGDFAALFAPVTWLNAQQT